jgi:hypothetical protein
MQTPSFSPSPFRFLRLGATLAFALFLLGRPAHAQAVDFMGEHYQKKSEDRSQPEEKFADLGTGNPDKRFTVHHFLQSGNDPVQAAIGAARLIQERAPDIRSAILKNPNANETMLDFTIPSNKDGKMEFHVLKYTPAPGGAGLIAAEYRYAFNANGMNADQVKKIRMDALNAMATFDVAKAAAGFNLQ